MGLAPTAPPKQPLAPAKTIRPTPTTSRSTTTSQPSTISRKREAPTPTPSGTGLGIKRQKVSQPPSVGMGSTIRQTSSKSRIPSGMGTISTGQRTISSSTSGSNKIRDKSPQPNLIACGLPRPIGISSRIPSHTTTTYQQTSYTTQPLAVLPPLHGLAKANGRRPPRQSFRPRQSIICGFISGSVGVEVDIDDEDVDGGGGRGMEEMMEEDEGDVFE